MKKDYNKKAFTIVELVIVIAVVAVLAAVLIPTFACIIGKANDSAALMDANNMAGQILPDIVERINEAGDLVIVQQKDDNYYIHAYLVDSGSLIAYRDNPIAKEELKNYLTDNRYTFSCDGIDDNFADTVEIAIQYLYNKGVILPAMYTGDGDWWDPDKMSALAAGLEIDVDTARVRSDYKVIVGAFEKPATDSDNSSHTCSSATVTKYEGQKKTCVKNGWEAYYVCSCGKLYSDENAGSGKLLAKIDVEKAEGHSDGGGYVKLDDTYHNKKCRVCGALFGKEEHTPVYIERDSYYESTCACVQGGEKIDLDGNSDELPATFKLAMRLNLLLKRDAANAGANSKHPTMYDAFSAIQTNANTTYSDISGVISAIEKAESDDKTANKHSVYGKNAGALNIVWDQNIDRFAVVCDKDTMDNGLVKHYSVAFVPYQADYWLKGDDISSNDLYNYWDTFDETPKTSQNAQATYFSIYFKKQESSLFSGNDKVKTFVSGIDMGENEQSQSVGLTIVTKVKDGQVVIRTSGKINLTVKIGSGLSTSSGTVYHYGALVKLSFDKNGNNNNVKYHEFGEVGEISTLNDDCKNQIIFTAESDSKFQQSDDDVKDLFANNNFTDNGATFSSSES